MTEPRLSPPEATPAVSVAEFGWRDLRFRVITADTLTDEQRRVLEAALPRVGSVGRFADVLGIVLGRRVRIRTERPSADITFEVGL